MALESMGNSEKTKALQAEEDEDSEEDSEEEDEPSLLFRRVNQLWKKRQGKFKGSRRTGGRSESTSGQKKSSVRNEVICFECKEPGHYKNGCPKMNKDRPKKKDFRGKKKGLMANQNDSKSLEDDSEEEQANMVLMVYTKAYAEKIQSESKSESDSEDVFPNLSRSELESYLSGILEKYQKLQNKYKDLKQVHVSESEAHNKLKKDFYTLNEENFILEK